MRSPIQVKVQNEGDHVEITIRQSLADFDPKLFFEALQIMTLPKDQTLADYEFPDDLMVGIKCSGH